MKMVASNRLKGIMLYYEAYSAALQRWRTGKPCIDEYEAERLRAELRTDINTPMELIAAGCVDAAYACGVVAEPSAQFVERHAKPHARALTLKQLLKTYNEE